MLISKMDILFLILHAFSERQKAKLPLKFINFLLKFSFLELLNIAFANNPGKTLSKTLAQAKSKMGSHRSTGKKHLTYFSTKKMHHAFFLTNLVSFDADHIFTC